MPLHGAGPGRARSGDHGLLRPPGTQRTTPLGRWRLLCWAVPQQCRSRRRLRRAATPRPAAAEAGPGAALLIVGVCKWSTRAHRTAQDTGHPFSGIFSDCS